MNEVADRKVVFVGGPLDGQVRLVGGSSTYADLPVEARGMFKYQIRRASDGVTFVATPAEEIRRD